MSPVSKFLLRQGHVVWLASIANIALGFFIPGFNAFSQSISAVGHQAPAFAYTHRALDIIVGICICGFGTGLNHVRRGRAPFSMALAWLFGASFISAGIWTLENPLHLLYNLSIVLVLVPVTCALELRELVKSRRFETLSLITSFVDVLMFWCIYAGFVSQGISGLVERLWTVFVMGWFGIAVLVIEQASAAGPATATHGATAGSGGATAQGG